MINSLLRMPYDGTLCCSNNMAVYKHILKSEALLIVGNQTVKEAIFEMDYNYKNKSYVYKNELINCSFSYATSSDLDSESFAELYDNIVEFIKKEGYVEGFEILSLSTGQKFWISNFDLDFLEKNYGVLC